MIRIRYQVRGTHRASHVMRRMAWFQKHSLRVVENGEERLIDNLDIIRRYIEAEPPTDMTFGGYVDRAETARTLARLINQDGGSARVHWAAHELVKGRWKVVANGLLAIESTALPTEADVRQKRKEIA